LLRLLFPARRTNGNPIVNISGLKTLSLHVNPEEMDMIVKWFTVCTELTHISLFESEHLLMSRGFADLFLSST